MTLDELIEALQKIQEEYPEIEEVVGYGLAGISEPAFYLGRLDGESPTVQIHPAGKIRGLK